MLTLHATWPLLFFVVSLLVGCTTSKTQDLADPHDEVRRTSLSVPTIQSRPPVIDFKEGVATTTTASPPVVNDALKQRPEPGQAQVDTTPTSLKRYTHAQPPLNLEVIDTSDFDSRPEVIYTYTLPPPGFRGVLYAHTNYPAQASDTAINLQFLDAETNSISRTEVTEAYAYNCWTYFGADGRGWYLLYDDYGPTLVGNTPIPVRLVRGYWGEVPTATPISIEESYTLIDQLYKVRAQFDAGQLSFALSHYDNGFSLEVNGVVRQYFVQPWDFLQHTSQYEDIISSDNPVFSQSHSTKNMVLSGSGTIKSWHASLHGSDGELFAISFNTNEPVCSKKLVYFVSMVTGEIVYCTWTNAEFLLVPQPSQRTVGDELRLPPSGWFSNDPCTNDETGLTGLAAVLETTGRRLDN